MTTAVQDSASMSALMSTMNSGSAGSATAAGSATDIQNRFLTLLVTQMKNQDPLNPMDNAQVTNQMAQLSTVTGIDKLNATLASLVSDQSQNDTVQAAGMIGHDVLSAGSRITLDKTGSDFGVELAGPADSLKVAITDNSGRVVRTLDLGAQQAGVQTIHWDGMSDAGAAATAGEYNFSVTAVQAGGSVNATTLAVGHVQSVSRGSQGVKLNLGNLGSVGLADVRQIL